MNVAVAVAVIVDEQDRILITQRALNSDYGGYWEFPGGKLEREESVQDALKRELLEELGILVDEYTLLGEIHHQYPDKHISLNVFLVKKFSGQPRCVENQLALRWVDRDRIRDIHFLPANHKIIELLDQ